MIQTVHIPFRLPTLNEIITLQSRMHKRTGHNEWNDLKQEVERRICFCLKGAGVRAVRRVDHFIYRWQCRDRRCDKSNIAAGGRKVFEDALVAYGAIPNDGWNEIGDWDDKFDHPAPWGVTIEMHSEDSQGEIGFEEKQNGRRTL